MTLHPSELDRNVSVFNVAGFIEALNKPVQVKLVEGWARER
jgi:hypothetical protein